MDFVSVFRFIIENFEREKIDFALIGGFALQGDKKDIDLMIYAKDKDKIKSLFLATGYQILHEGDHILSFTGKSYELGRVDFMLVKGEAGIRILKRSRPSEIIGGKYLVKSVIPEDIIGLKVQSYANNPDRKEKDFSDIKGLFRKHKGSLDMELVREYFAMFDKSSDLEGLNKEN